MPVAFIERVPAKCKDCYKCLRECPVKAIQVEQASDSHEMHVKIIEERCILDGRCIAVCPQKAKHPRSDVKAVKTLLSRGHKVAAAIAPSFAALLPLKDPLQLPTILRNMGFSTVSETAVGAEIVARAYHRFFKERKGPLIATACPAIVNLVERHYPEVIPYLAPLVSPAVAHARYLKRIDKDLKVVFIGPCVAKKDEVQRPDSAFSVDVVLTFTELWSWIQEESLCVDSVPSSHFDPPYPDEGRLFPAEGGLLKAAGIHEPPVSRRIVVASGIENCVELIKHLKRGEGDLDLVELMACSGGCLGGPCAVNDLDVFTRRQRLFSYRESQKLAAKVKRSETIVKESEDLAEKGSPPPDASVPELPDTLLFRTYRDRKPREEPVPEEELRKILAMTGKYSPEDELNCGACGYGSCRDKAVACWKGLADPTMCIPYMRQKAESMANLIVSAIPSAIIVVSREGTIMDANPSFQMLTKKSMEQLNGAPIESLLPDDVVSQIRQVKGDSIYRGSTEFSGRFFDVTIFPEPTQRARVIILTDKTEERKDRERLEKMREETLGRVEQVIRKQMEVAQKIAGLLGETTAETKGSLSQLVRILKRDMEGPTR